MPLWSETLWSENIYLQIKSRGIRMNGQKKKKLYLYDKAVVGWLFSVTLLLDRSLHNTLNIYTLCKGFISVKKNDLNDWQQQDCKN